LGDAGGLTVAPGGGTVDNDNETIEREEELKEGAEARTEEMARARGLDASGVEADAGGEEGI
jgi:hypothetical protein